MLQSRVLGFDLGSSESLKKAWYSTQVFQKALQASRLAMVNSKVSLHNTCINQFPSSKTSFKNIKDQSPMPAKLLVQGPHPASDFPLGSLEASHLLKSNDWQPSEEQTGLLLKNRAFSMKQAYSAHPPHLTPPFTPSSLPGTFYEVVRIQIS